MTRSSTKKLFTPFKDPKREFRSSRKHFKTLSLDESRSPDFDLFSDQEEYSEEEVTKTMAETMKQYMSKTRVEYGSGIARPKIEDNDSFESKGQFLKGLRDNTFSGGGYRATAPGLYQINNANPSYQERRQSMEDTLSKFMSELAKRHEENSNLIKEIRASTDAAIRNQGESIKTLEIQIRKISKVLLERGFESLPSSIKTNPRDQVKSIPTIIEVDSYSIRRMGSSQYAISTGRNRILMYETKQTTIPFLSHLNGYYYEENKDSYGLQFLEAHSEASHINNSIPK
nr:hypothetical protein [Tanacetum cinerariifolium]